jgi:hypothetical protein
MVDTTIRRPGLFFENAVFYFSFILLALAASAFFYVRHLASAASAELSNLDAQMAEMKTGEQRKLENDVNAARRRLDDFSRIISARNSARDLFAKLENLIVPGVYLSKMSADFTEMSAELSGHGNNFSEMERQAIKFRNSPEILKSASLEKISTVETGGVDFSATAVFNSGIKKSE